MDDPVGQGAVYRRSGEEAHVAAQVVAAGLAERAGAARHAGLQSHAVADSEVADRGADRGDDARGLVADHHRRGEDEVPDTAVLPVVDVRAADADALDLDQAVGRTQRGDEWHAG